MKIEKLQGLEQWVTWKFQMRQILESYEVYDVVTGIELPPAESDRNQYAEKLAAWKKLDSKARRYISTALGKQPLLHVLNCTTANQMWTSLKNVYESTSKSSILLLQQKYMSFVKDPRDDMATFLSKLLDITQQLKERDETLSDSMIMTTIQLSLPVEYNHFHSAWDSTTEAARTLENMKSRLLVEESRMKAQGRSETVEAFTANKNESSGHGKKKTQYRKKKRDKSGGCFNCGSTEHWQRDCKQPKKTDAGKSGVKHGEALVCETVSSTDGSDVWILDSGASDHVCKRREWFINFQEASSTVKIGDGNMIPVRGRGDINILAFDGTKWSEKHIANVLYVPDMHVNLFSSGKAMDRGLKMRCDKDRCEFIKDGSIAAVGARKGNLFQMIFKVVPANGNSTANIATKRLSLRMWHEKLGHQNLVYVRNYLRNNGIDFNDENFTCEACLQGKQHRLSFENRIEKATACGEIIHSDV